MFEITGEGDLIFFDGRGLVIANVVDLLKARNCNIVRTVRIDPSIERGRNRKGRNIRPQADVTNIQKGRRGEVRVCIVMPSAREIRRWMNNINVLV